MKFEAKTYKRTGAMIGSIIGVLAMIVAVCMEKNVLGAGALILCVCVGVLLGSVMENKLKIDKF